jgi:hypothetical protein
MWPWQLKNIHKRHLLWLKFFSVCLFAHLTFLSWVFFIDHDGSHTISVSLNKHMDYSAPILFVPLKSSSFAKASADTAKQTTTVQSTVVTPTKKAVTPSKPTPTAQPVKKTSTPTTTLTVAKPALVKKVTPAPTAPAKTTPQPSITKTIENKPVTAPSFAKASAGRPVAKEVAKKTKPEQQKITPEKSVPPMAKAIDPANLQQTTEQPAGISPQRIITENAHISDDYREVEAMRRTALLQKELLNNWKPPLGIPASATCEISFTVDKNGTIKTTTMVKSSGIVMYDLSARHALFAMKMPKWTHGKTVTINFKQ